MAKKEEVIEAYLFLRENNTTIPDDVLDLMKEAALEKLDESHFSFTGVGIPTLNGGNPGVGVWTDGLMLSSDNAELCDYRLEPGKQYKVSVSEA